MTRNPIYDPEVVAEEPEYTLQLSDRWEPEKRREPVSVSIDRLPLHDGCTVSLTLFEGMGNPTRYVELTPAEARELAKALTDMAKRAER